jgi:hypothetical protein
MKTKDSETKNVLLNPHISRPSRLLWAVLREWEQEGKPDTSIDELVTILGVTEGPVRRYLNELEKNGCLKWNFFARIRYSTVISRGGTFAKTQMDT